MFQMFELIMTCVLAYMAYTVLEGTAAPVVLVLLLLVQAMFWTLDFLFIRTSHTSRIAMDTSGLSHSYSHG